MNDVCFFAPHVVHAHTPLVLFSSDPFQNLGL